MLMDRSVRTAATLAEAFDAVCMMDAPMSERLAAYAEKLRELSFPFADAYEELITRLIEGRVGAEAPAVGDLMPPFALPSRANTIVDLESLIADGPVVISFNRGHWCPFCKIELKTIASYHEQIARYGARVVSIVPDRQEFAGKLPADILDKVTILSDIDHGYSLSIGIVMWIGNRVSELMSGHGYRLEEYQGNDGWFLPLPATFVVGADGRILGRRVDPDFRTRMDVDDILKALRRASAA